MEPKDQRGLGWGSLRQMVLRCASRALTAEPRTNCNAKAPPRWMEKSPIQTVRAGCGLIGNETCARKRGTIGDDVLAVAQAVNHFLEQAFQALLALDHWEVRDALCYQIVRPLEQARDALASAPQQTMQRPCTGRSLHSLEDLESQAAVPAHLTDALRNWPAREPQDGADGGTRTRIPFREADFRTTSAFAAASWAFVVWTIPSPRPSDRRRHPSSLYTFPGGAWLGIGLGRTLSFPRL